MNLHLHAQRAISAALFPLFLASPVLASPVLADVIVVDEAGGPGSDFTDLPPAVASASHNDLILVRAGDYTGFTTAKGIRLLGLTGAVMIQSDCRIQDLHSARKFIMTSVRATRIEVVGCDGHVALESINSGFGTRLRNLVITDSVDVRVRDSRLRCYDEYAGPTVDVTASEVELVRCEIDGYTGGFEWRDAGESGSTAVHLALGSRARISLCEIEGGSGTDVWTEWWVDPGHGAPAVHAQGGSEVVITGSGAELIQGGHCGWAGQFASDAGAGAPALFAEETSTIRCSGVVLQGGWGSSSPVAEILTTTGGTVDLVSPPDPTLEILGVALPGQLLTMRVTGPVGGNVRYLLGRIPEINYLVGGFGPDLLVEIRIVNPGTIPASGVRDYNFVLPGNLPQGMYFLGQAKVVYQGTTFRTPSQILLVR